MRGEMVNLAHWRPQPGGMGNKAPLKQALPMRLELVVGGRMQDLGIGMGSLIPARPNDNGGPWHRKGIPHLRNLYTLG